MLDWDEVRDMEADEGNAPPGRWKEAMGLPPAGRGMLHDKIVSNIQEVRARGARTIVIAEEGDEALRPYADHLIVVPRTPTLLAPLVTTVPLQVFAAEIARSRKHDVDQPRNLAKSVTVE